MSQNPSERAGGGGIHSPGSGTKPPQPARHWWRVGREGLGVESRLKPTIWHHKK